MTHNTSNTFRNNPRLQRIPSDQREWVHWMNELQKWIPELTINVKKYGAKGDGVTDDGPAIQLALNAVAAANGTLYFPGGEYMTGQTLILKTFDAKVAGRLTGDTATGRTFSIRGDGPHSTIIKLMNDANVNLMVDQHWDEDLEFTAGNMVMQDITLDGNRDNNTSGSCMISHGFWYEFRDMYFQEASDDGFEQSVATKNGTFEKGAIHPPFITLPTMGAMRSRFPVTDGGISCLQE